MAKLVYAAITSLDGYVADEAGTFDWAAPDEEVHAYVNDLERPIGTYLYGRRMYDVMVFWETCDDPEPVMRDYTEVWREADKVVYSTTLTAPRSERTRIEPTFDAAGVRALKDSSARDLSIGGPTIAAHALRAGLVDELHQFVTPVLVGGGTRWLPSEVHSDLQLVDMRTFASGVVHLHYQA
jgi:dihydrofolate reductase